MKWFEQKEKSDNEREKKKDSQNKRPEIKTKTLKNGSKMSENACSSVRAYKRQRERVRVV